MVKLLHESHRNIAPTNPPILNGPQIMQQPCTNYNHKTVSMKNFKRGCTFVERKHTHSGKRLRSERSECWRHSSYKFKLLHIYFFLMKVYKLKGVTSAQGKKRCVVFEVNLFPHLLKVEWGRARKPDYNSLQQTKKSTKMLVNSYT